MPYIKQDRRGYFDAESDSIARKVETVGEINYAITRILHKYLFYNGISYANLSALNGVLHDVAMELYRSVAVPYEIKKAKENGRVGILGDSEKSD